jgi:hypothetical protein
MLVELKARHLLELATAQEPEVAGKSEPARLTQMLDTFRAMLREELPEANRPTNTGTGPYEHVTGARYTFR